MKILIVDEQRLILKALSSFLGDSGHESYMAETVEEAVGLAGAGLAQVDVIVLDPGNVEDSARENIDRLHNTYQSADLLITNQLTLRSSYAYSRGVFAYLRKPVKLAELELLLARIADKRNPVTLTRRSTQTGLLVI